MVLLLGCSNDDPDDVATSAGSTGTTETSTGEATTGTASATGQSTGTVSASGQSTEIASTTDASESSDESGVVVNGCGTFDPNTPGDSVIPQDPDDPEIIEACTALCEALTGVPDCETDAAACLDTCKMRSCNICPGTLAPLVDCETEMFAPDGCSCGTTGAECPIPEGCRELASDTNACGG